MIRQNDEIHCDNDLFDCMKITLQNVHFCFCELVNIILYIDNMHREETHTSESKIKSKIFIF